VQYTEKPKIKSFKPQQMHQWWMQMVIKFVGYWQKEHV